MTKTKFVDFDRPPVVEVVCGVAFGELPRFTVAHLGRFWTELGSGFREVAEQPPLATVIESFESSPSPGVAIQLGPPVMPRVWFISDEEDHLVQVQRDRFLCNWRKLTEKHEYPSYDWVSERFESRLQLFEKFAAEQCGAAPSYTQYELTYINHIAAGEGWSNLADLGAVLPDCGWRGGAGRFLPTPEGIDWTLSFVLPGKKGRLRLHLRSGESRKDRKAVLMMDLTARGFDKDRAAWFELAHEWIVKGFADLTAKGVQQSIWGRKK